MKSTLLALLILFSLPSLAQEVQFENGSVTLFGDFIDSEDKDKAVLFIAGSGPTDRNGNNSMMTNNAYKMLAESLSESNIASLRYDKRGVGKSQIEGFTEADLRFEQFVNDAKAGVQFLIGEGFKSVVIAGHSQGSLVGILAAQNNEQVSGFISIAGLGTDMGSTIVEQLSSQAEILGEQSQILIDSIMAGHSPKRINPFLVSIFRPELFPYLMSCIQYDPAEELSKLTQPSLVLNGTTDIQISVEHAELLAGESAELKIYEGMNHVLKSAPIERMLNIATYNQPDLPLVEGLVDDIVLFVNSQNKGK